MVRRLLLSLSTLAAATAAMAVPVNVSLTGTGSGSLNGASFSGATYTIKGTSDTDFAFDNGSGANILYLPTFEFSVAGVGSGVFNYTGRFFINQAGAVGFGDYYGGDFIDANIGSAASEYDFTSDLGPHTGPVFWLDMADRHTSAGLFTLGSTGHSSLTIQLQAVPEPASLLSISFGIVVALRKKATFKQRKQGDSCAL